MTQRIRHLLAALLLVCLIAPAADANESQPFIGEGFTRKTIYHSPQSPGWTSWVGAWQMPDGGLMVSFTQATGPVGDARPKRSYKGLHVAVVYLRSTDGGESWQKVAESDVSFGTGADSGLGTHANNGGTTIALKDGSLLRRVYGWDYGAFPALPGTAFMQLSRDGGKTWSDPPRSSDGGRNWSDPSSIQEFLLDPAKTTVQPTRTRRLSDGRLLIEGNVWNQPNAQKGAHEPLLMVSEDEAKTWKRVNLAGEGYNPEWNRKFNEWDIAELSSGDLLVVSRPDDNTNRWVGTMTRRRDGWQLTAFARSELPHSGHPELLATREGPILHLATTGIDSTQDGGKTWQPLEFPDADKSLRPRESPKSVSTRYYPRSLQTSDGKIFVFAHRGSDNDYGKVDQAIVMDTFRLVKKR